VLIAGNWKLFKTRAETAAFCDAFEPPAGVDVVIAPTFTSLDGALRRGLPVYAQNVHWAREGAATRSGASTSARPTRPWPGVRRPRSMRA
jgi:triosephosphate isomerase